MTDCATRLAEARDALHRLSTGVSVVAVDAEGHRVEYTPARRGDLVRYIRELEAECGTPAVTRRRPMRFVG